MKVEIIREPGDVRAPDIVDELCTTDACAIKRGQNYLDENGSDRIEYELAIAPLDDIPSPGAIVGIQDASMGQAFEAKVTGYTLSVTAMSGTSPLTVNTTMQLERSMQNE
jgi:hypothetical protein